MCEVVASAADLELAGRFAPGHGYDDPHALASSDVIVEFASARGVMGNVAIWRRLGASLVIGSSGFDEAALASLRSVWGDDPPGCLVAPNFSIGGVLMMWVAEKLAPYFTAAEVIELHHDRKADAPSGTALATASRMRPGGRRSIESEELRPGARGTEVGGVWVHSIRLPGLLAHQEVLLGNPGEVLSIRHDTSDRTAFVP
ncbi:MAG TPA: 4-hydroxy-tetrahydrodipicolinate reductase, partial [Acidimicrobiia bacterium]